MPKLVVGNWKQNPGTLAEARALIAAITPASEVVVAPPTIYLGDLTETYTEHVFGAQDVSTQPLGAHTGEVGADMLKNLSVAYVIVGHSERRTLGESDIEVAAKARVVLEHGMIPIYCVGEPKSIRDQSMDIVRQYLGQQASFIPAADKLVIAYEPIWAIGSGTPDDPASAAAVMGYIAGLVSSRVSHVRTLYGGSVTPDTAPGFFAEEAIDGVLVGGASLSSSKFNAIVDAAQ